MSLSLKHIPCPAGNVCTAFQCIFGHEREKAPAPPLVAPTATPKKGESVAVDQDGPRKRPRLDSQSDAPTSSSSPHDPKKQRVTDGESQTSLRAATRPISPPPLKKQTPSSSSTRVSATRPAATSSPAHHKSTPSKVSAPSEEKKESLNPRLLKGAPASHETRLKLVRLLHQQFERLNTELRKDANAEEGQLVLIAQKLITLALDEEQRTATQKPAVYANLMKNKVMQYKRMGVAQWKEERLKSTKSAAEQKKAPAEAGSDAPVKIETGLTVKQEVEVLRRLLTPIKELTQHGYVATIPTDEEIEKSRQGVEASKGWEKCDRCQQRFQVFPGRREEDGALTSGGSCVFHWGKAYVPQKTPGDTTRKAKRYHCCGEDIGDSAGCFTKNHHVFKTSDPKRLAAVLNFKDTPENLAAVSGRAVCFDCEMGYTVYGMELIRLTATSWPTGEELLDVLVKPVGEILDLNSRFSGVWPEDMAKAKPWTAGDDLKPVKLGYETGSEDGEVKHNKGDIKIVSSPEVARDLLFSLLSPSTPLIGHGLENDLNAVRMTHPTLVDTILLYPHKGGLPFRYGLKHLMDATLNRKIQQDTGPKSLGHDSAEDARAAGELARFKVMQMWKDMKWEGWKVGSDEELEPPPAWKAENWSLTEDFIER